MAKITILGAGITGLSIATILTQQQQQQQQQSSRGRNCPAHTITILARDLPGDVPSQRWASPWACAGWVALGGAPRERRMQLDALAHLRALAAAHPESSVRSVVLTDCFGGPGGGGGGGGGERDRTSAEGVGFCGEVPGFEVLEEEGREKVGVRYESVVLTPGVFLVWLRGELERAGVRFERIAEVKALGELKGRGHDVLINASGIASATLEDVKDSQLIMDRTHVVVVKSKFEGGYVHRGPGPYTYIFGRGDGTAVVGGVSEMPQIGPTPKPQIHQDLFRRASKHLPEHFPSPDPANYEIIEHLEGIRPLRPAAGVRVEREEINGQNVIHAYGTTIGGYILSFGLGLEVARLLEEDDVETDVPK